MSHALQTDQGPATEIMSDTQQHVAVAAATSGQTTIEVVSWLKHIQVDDERYFEVLQPFAGQKLRKC